MPDDREILARAAAIIDSVFIGVLSTVNSAGQPNSRYMAAVLESERLYRLYSLSGRDTRKVADIRQSPTVCWCFRKLQGPGSQAEVTLYGKTELYPTTELPMSAWNRLIDYTEPYALPGMRATRDERHAAFVALITEIETIDFVDPEFGVATPRTIAP